MVNSPALATRNTAPTRAPPAIAPDIAARVRLASSPTTAPDQLANLAYDPDLTVRAALASNLAAPPEANERLLGDQDARVRELLGRRLIALCPRMEAEQQDAVRQHVQDVLTRLLSDEVVRVRAAIADLLKDMPSAPPALVRLAAQDAHASVSTPVIRMSPLLTSEDLLGLLATRPQIAVHVAARPQLDPQVCEAIADGADATAIAVLLSNHGAQMREATLDALAARAQAYPGWHAPLVRRPCLSARAVAHLVQFIADDLLRHLAGRSDLPSGLVETVQQRLAARAAATDTIWPEEDPPPATAIAFAQLLRTSGRADAAALEEAIRRNQRRLAAALLAVIADVPPRMVQRSVRLRSAKALVALVWKGGLPARLGPPLQLLLTQLPPDGLLLPDAQGGCPLSEEEMRWQLEFLSGGE